ncbi:MAG TPA: DUF3540 domain-containing protein [Planctomycetota bacterium]|nr:DUF3540 domain-containing protein [Planctomycetota bacterium]
MLTEMMAQVGTATILAVDGSRVSLSIDGAEAEATMALAYPYRPAPGDTVLALGQESQWYVIGVLRGSGVTTFVAPGDMELRAPNGSIGLTAADGVRIEAPRVSLKADRLELAARSVFERFVQAYRRIAGVFQLRAGRVRTVVGEAYDLRAGRITERADADVRIDGDKIYLG